MVARSYVMMDYDIPEEQVAEAVALTPGIESPTVSPLHREGWVAVRAMVPARRRPPGDGRALDHRRPGDPGDRHPCLPSLSRRCRTPGVPSACGWRACFFGGLLVVVCVAGWFAVGPEVRARVTVYQQVDDAADRGAGRRRRLGR